MRIRWLLKESLDYDQWVLGWSKNAIKSGDSWRNLWTWFWLRLSKLKPWSHQIGVQINFYCTKRFQTWHAGESMYTSAKIGQKLLETLILKPYRNDLNIKLQNHVFSFSKFQNQDFQRSNRLFGISRCTITDCSLLVPTLDAVIEAQKAATYRYKIQNSKNKVNFWQILSQFLHTSQLVWRLADHFPDLARVLIVNYSTQGLQCYLEFKNRLLRWLTIELWILTLRPLWIFLDFTVTGSRNHVLDLGFSWNLART